MFVSYSRKGDKTYAKMVTSRRIGGVVAGETSNLGRVVDRERHVFRSRERGTSALGPKGDEFGPALAGGWPVPPERLVLDFGDAWALDSLATSEGLWGAPGAASPSDSDSSQSTRVVPDALTAQARPTEAPSSVPVPSSVRVMAETAASQPNSAPSSRRGLGSRPRPRRPRPSRRRRAPSAGPPSRCRPPGPPGAVRATSTGARGPTGLWGRCLLYTSDAADD